MIYLLVLILGGFLSLKFDGKESVKKNMYVNIYIYILVLLSAISDNLGADSCTYREVFHLYNGDFSKENLIIWTFLYGYMPLWTSVNELAAALGFNYTFVQILIALSINLVIGYFIKQNTDYPFTALVIYFLVSYFYLNFEVQREALAIAIGFIGIIYFLKRRYSLFCFFTSIAILFHISAICLLAFPFIPYFKISWARLVLAFCISLSLYIASNYLVTFLPSFGGSLGDRVDGYANRTVTVFGFLLHTINRLFIPFVSYLIVREAFPNKYGHIKKYIPFYLCFSVLACAVPGTFRFLNYMIPISILIMSYLFVSLFKRKVMGYKFVLGIIICFLYISQNISNMLTYFPICGYHRYDLYLPYSTIYDDYEDLSYRDLIHREALNGATNDNNRKH